MKSTVEPLEGNKVKLSVEVDEDEFEKAGRRRLPAHRPGGPHPRLPSRQGAPPAARGPHRHRGGPCRRPAARPARVLRPRRSTRHEVDVIAAPEIDITSGEDDGPVAFDAVVEVRPAITLGGYDDLRVTIDAPEASDEEIDEQIDHLREHFAELDDGRTARPSTATTCRSTSPARQDGEPLAGLTAEDYLYEVGSGTVVAEIDENLSGAKPGDILEFNADHPDPDEEPGRLPGPRQGGQGQGPPGRRRRMGQARPPSSTPSTSCATDLATRLGTVKKVQGQMALQQKTAEALADLVERRARPTPWSTPRCSNGCRTSPCACRPRALDLEQWLEATGQDQEAFVNELRDTATQAVKVDLALRALADAEEIDIDDDDLTADSRGRSAVGQKPEQVRKQFERSRQVPLVRSDLRKRKALEWLIEHVEIVDEQGNPVDRSALEVDQDQRDDDQPAGDDGTTQIPSDSRPDDPTADQGATEDHE